MHLAWLGIAKVIACGVSVAIMCLALLPLVQALAGRNTGVSVNIALGLTASVTVAGIASFVRAARLGGEVRRLENRNTRLEADVQVLRERVRRLGGDPDAAP